MLLIMENTYFELIPRELLYIILYNLEIDASFGILGNSFPIVDVQFFYKIIRRDFHIDINLDLIEYREMTLERYNSFLNIFREVYDNLVNSRYKYVRLGFSVSLLTFKNLKKLGINLENSIIKEDYLKLYDFIGYNSGKSAWTLNLFPKNDDVGLRSINIVLPKDKYVNMLFFFLRGSTFKLI
jgi:hypothetical protein